MNNIKTVTLASAAALFALAAVGTPAMAQAATGSVHCYGVNSCKGTADCKTTQHECKGMNSCKGQGFKAMGADMCLKRGGTIGDIG